MKDQRRRFLINSLTLLSMVGALTLATVGPAGASTIGDCTVEAAAPAPVKLTDSGRKKSAARAEINCATTHKVEVELLLYGDDPFFDDLVDRGSAGATVMPKPGLDYLAVDHTAFFSPRISNCNEDRPGDDELYSKVRAKIQTNGVWSGWSSRDVGRTVKYNCG
jgi:hypothetical protein